jgi:hypothetical protein
MSSELVARIVPLMPRRSDQYIVFPSGFSPAISTLRPVGCPKLVEDRIEGRHAKQSSL